MNLVDEADLALRMGDETDPDGPGRRAGNRFGIAHADPTRRPAALDRRQLQGLELRVNSCERVASRARSTRGRDRRSTAPTRKARERGTQWPALPTSARLHRASCKETSGSIRGVRGRARKAIIVRRFRVANPSFLLWSGAVAISPHRGMLRDYSEESSGERGFSSRARAALAGLPMRPLLVSNLAFTSQSRQSTWSRSIACAIAARASGSCPACSRTSAIWRYGDAAHGWIDFAARASSSAFAVSFVAAASWLWRMDNVARTGIPSATISASATTTVNTATSGRRGLGREGGRRDRARPGEQSKRNHRDDAHGGELPHPVDPCLEQVPGSHGQERGDRGLVLVVPAQEAAGPDRRGGDEEPEEEDKPDDPQFAQGFDVERMGVTDEEGKLSVLRPPGLVRPGAPAVDRLILELVHSGRPELPASVAASAEKMRVDRLVQVRWGLLEILEMLNRVGRCDADCHRCRREDRDSRGERPREGSRRAEEAGKHSVQRPRSRCR